MIWYEWKRIWQSRLTQFSVIGCILFLLFCTWSNIRLIQTTDKEGNQVTGMAAVKAAGRSQGAEDPHHGKQGAHPGFQDQRFEPDADGLQRSVFPALQVGVIDGQENPVAVFYASKLYETQKYFSLTSHVYSPRWCCSA